MLIKQAIIEGFGSCVDETIFQIDRGGIHLVLGENGAGKTTIFNALVWGLYQINLKGVKNEEVASWEHLRGQNYVGTRVMVYLESEGVHYCVARHLNYKGETNGVIGESRLMLFKDELATWGESGWDWMSEQHKADQQVVIDKLLGMDAKAFMSSVMFGQRMARFIAADASEKRNLFERVFGLEFVDQAKAVAQNMFDELAASIGGLNGKLSLKRQKIEQLEERIARIEQEAANFETQRAQRASLLRERIDTLQNEIIALTEEITGLVEALGNRPDVSASDFQTLQAAYNRLVGDLSAVSSRLGSYNQDIDRQGKKVTLAADNLDNVNTTCPTCGGELKPDKIADAKKQLKETLEQEEAAFKALLETRDKIVEQKADLQGKVEEARASMEAARDAHNEVEAERKLVEELGRKKAGADARLDEKRKAIQQVSGDLEKVLNEQLVLEDTTAIRAQIAQFNEETASIEQEVAEKTEKSEHLQWWIKKGFGANGLKSYIFNAMLDNLNAAVLKYASTLGYNVVFSIDLSKASKPFVTTCYMHDRVVNYDALSGGQKQRVDVALAMALHDVIAVGKNNHLLIMDEVFEGLDKSGIDMVFELLRAKLTDQTTVYVITHFDEVDWLQAKSITARLVGEKTVIE